MLVAASSARHRPLSVCHIISGHVWAGAQVQVATLLKSLSASSELKLHCIVLEEGRLARELRQCGVRVAVVPHQSSLLHILSQSADFLKHQGIQILHAHGYKENILASLLARRCGIALQVRTFHGARTPFVGLKPRHRGALLLDRLTTRYLVDHNIIVSRHLASTLGQELAPEKVSVIQNGIDASNISSSFDVLQARQRLNIPGDALVVGTAARLEEVKRLDLFHDTAVHLSREYPNVRFVIAGTGSQEQVLKNLFRESGLESRVHFLGHRDDVYDVLRAFDVMLITSDQEGLPMVVLEAMALEIPVVSRAVGGIPELIEDGSSGILVPTGEPLALAQACSLVLRNRELRGRLGRAAAKIVTSRFSARGNADQTCRVYLDLAARVNNN